MSDFAFRAWALCVFLLVLGLALAATFGGGS